MRHKHEKRWAVLFVWILVITGCWDRTEIEDIGIVTGIAIDQPEKMDKQGKDNKKIDLTHNIVIPQAAAGKSAGSKKAYANVTTKTESVFEGIRQVSTVTGNSPSYEYLKVLAISEDIARAHNLQELLNFFLRNTEARRTVKVVIVQGKAKDVLDKHPIIENNPAVNLSDIVENSKKVIQVTPEVTLGDVSKRLTSQRSLVIPRVMVVKDKAQMSGAAVIKGKNAKMIGTLTPEEVGGLSLLRGEVKNGIVKGKTAKGKFLVFEVDRIQHQIQSEVEKEQVHFTLRINVKGKLREDNVMAEDDFDEKVLQEAERVIQNQLEKLTQRTLRKTQKELKVDVIGFGKELSIENHQVWKKYEQNWDEAFSRMPVKVDIQTKIMEFGTKGRERIKQ
ncbi:spore germination protein [Aneurinibacillus soli]|uniref:Spore germination protein A3 n=1 Tax=Aneurinibacillus soli TaxID=1500254 RepID=A0A0U4WIB2_9BACL|nr:Ger(x)C family spore germination protein [Aneurinibacillus soli]PYE64380.1 spore germination protein [Aneurinibacillus soli]BAU28329.1 Spore germination protein A3 precursor [Aneurinibacillus soli]